MVRIKILFLIATALMAVGCEESFTPAHVQTWAGTVDDLSAKVDQFQGATSEAIDKLEAEGFVGSDVGDRVDELGTEIDRLQPQIAEIAKAIEQTELTGKDVPAQWLEILQAANKGSAPINPYTGYVELGLGGAAALLGLLAAKKNKDANTYAAKYKAHKRGVERTIKENMDQMPQLQLYDNIGKARMDLGVS